MLNTMFQRALSALPIQGCSFIQIGDKRSLKRAFHGPEIMSFLSITGDNNPLHYDPEWAATSGFKGVIVPGILVASLFPAIIGSAFPGAVYVSQTLKFRAPSLAGQELEAEVIVSKRNREWVTFSTICKEADGTILVEGEAMARMPKTH